MALDLNAGPWGVYDANKTAEHDLFESAIVERNDIYGFEADYYVLQMTESSPMSADELDPLYGENQNEHYAGPFRTKITYTPPKENEFADIFGITNVETDEYATIPYYTFHRDVDVSFDPKAGDVIHFPWNGHTFIINNVCPSEAVFLAKRLLHVMTIRHYKLTNVDDLPLVDAITDSVPLSAWGDNLFIDTEADKIDPQNDLPNVEDIYGYEK